jgi:molecular chaperone DnaJ
LHLSFEDAVRGVTTTVNVPQDSRCRTCNGTGAAPGTSTHVCDRCNGRGTLDDNQGLFSLSTVCPKCNGRGTLVDTPCPTCHGTGTERRNRQVKVRIAPGVEDGQRIRVRGRGAPGAGMAPPGDLYVTVHVGAHPRFGRRGANLTLSVPITYPEAALGTVITVPTLDDPVKVKVAPGTAPGTTLRVKGRGIPSAKNGKPGDLLVKVEVVVPKSLTDEQRELLESLSKVIPPAPREAFEEV